MSADAVLSPGNPKPLQHPNCTPGCPQSKSEQASGRLGDAAAAPDSESNIQVQVDLEASPLACGAGSIVCQNLPDIGPQGMESANAMPMKQPSAHSDVDDNPIVPYLKDDGKEGFKLNVAAVANHDLADKLSFPPQLPNGPMIASGVNSWSVFANKKDAMLKA
ncbi:hypothetical protein L208DRAFT_1378592 [Tricholoma matsutake]|nr:hypothetical protein L208DRAFT_1378592 [Tricholoma matsutake 945]